MTRNLLFYKVNKKKKRKKKKKKKKEYKWESKLSKTFHLEDFKKTSHLNPLTHFQKLNQVPSRLDEEKKKQQINPKKRTSHLLAKQQIPPIFKEKSKN